MTHCDDIKLCLEAFAPSDGDLMEGVQVLEFFSQFVGDVVAPYAAECDRIGARLAGNRVSVPEPMVSAYGQFIELEWHRLQLSEAAGGFGLPEAVALMATELLAAANPSFQMLTGLVRGGADALVLLSPKLAERFLPLLADGTALATMALTEPGAGSDLGAIRTRAEQDAAGTWRLSGEKIFISGGDQNMSETVLHFVLARTSDAPGTRGLSLFLCPAKAEDGSVNAVFVSRIEDKMGLHASPTCQMRFDGAEAFLLGEEGRGLEGMFIMMNHARLDVAAQGIAAAASAHGKALAYARSRIQGRDDKGAPAALVALPDIRRMLVTMDILALGGRCMVIHAANLLSENPTLVRFLTPVVKTFCTDIGSDAADLGIQTLGGYGYLAEYEIERIWRDSRVARIYEGSNGTLASAFTRRELSDAVARSEFIADIQAAILDTSEQNFVAELLERWSARVADAARHPLAQQASIPLTRLTGLVLFAAVWSRLASAHPGDARLTLGGQFARDWVSTEFDRTDAQIDHLLARGLPMPA